MTANHSKQRLRRVWLVHVAQALLILAGAAGLALLSVRYHRVADWSANHRHTLSTASIKVLGTLPEPLKVTAYVSENPVVRERIRELFRLYQQHKPDLALHFVNPDDVADIVRSQHLTDGEIVLETAGRAERIRGIAEQDVTNALARLAHQQDQWLVFITGHGERSPVRGANYDVTDWAKGLSNRGLHVQELSLSQEHGIPDNTAVVVIASPQIGYLPGELARLRDYLARGGNLLWLTEPDEPKEMQELARMLGVERLAATIVDPVTQAIGIDNPAITVVTQYPAYPLFAGFNLATLFPFATPIHERPPPGWTGQRLLITDDKAWGETGAMSGNVGYDEGVDFPGPLPLAVELSRSYQAPGATPRPQRVMVIGDGDFLSNSYLGNQGNQDLGIRLAEWLAANDTMIGIESRTAADVSLDLKPWQSAVIAIGFLCVLPAAFALNGILIWWRRRRA